MNDMGTGTSLRALSRSLVSMKGRRGGAGSSLVVMVRHPEVRLDPSGTNLEQSPSFAGAQRETLGCRNYPPSLLGHGYFTPCLVATILHCKRWARILRGCNGASVATILYLRAGTGTSGAPPSQLSSTSRVGTGTSGAMACTHGMGRNYPPPQEWARVRLIQNGHHVATILCPFRRGRARVLRGCQQWLRRVATILWGNLGTGTSRLASSQLSSTPWWARVLRGTPRRNYPPPPRWARVLRGSNRASVATILCP